MIHASMSVGALAAGTFLWGTLADAGVVSAPAGAALQASGTIGMAVSAVTAGIADAGIGLRVCD
jgi:hypothetical protein